MSSTVILWLRVSSSLLINGRACGKGSCWKMYSDRDYKDLIRYCSICCGVILTSVSVDIVVWFGKGKWVIMHLNRVLFCLAVPWYSVYFNLWFLRMVWFNDLAEAIDFVHYKSWSSFKWGCIVFFLTTTNPEPTDFVQNSLLLKYSF